MKLLALTTYPEEDASVRHRLLQYVPGLEDAGWQVTIDSVVTTRLFMMKNRRGLWLVPKAVLLLAGLLRRLAIVLTVSRYDAVWIHREAFPFFTPMVERLVSRRAHGRVVLDFDDALHAPPPGGFDWKIAVS